MTRQLSLLAVFALLFFAASSVTADGGKEPWTGVESQAGYRDNALIDGELRKIRKHHRKAPEQDARDEDVLEGEEDSAESDPESDESADQE